MSASNIPVLFLRLEGPLQAWGQRSRHRVRETALEPTKSGVIGLIACCLGRRRGDAIDDLASLRMAVRIDRPGVVWRDYHTVGAGVGIMSADRKIKKTASTGQPETLVTDRFYLCDASFLVALTGDGSLLEAVEKGLRKPVWPPFLGRKACPPSLPLLADRGDYATLLDAVQAQPWRPRLPEVDAAPDGLRCVVECEADETGAALRFDCPTTFAAPRRMESRYVREVTITDFAIGEAVQNPYKPARLTRMNYRTAAWAERRRQRGRADSFLCVFCGVPSAITHHITYRRTGHETMADVRSVCRRCHDAFTMLESERAMGLDRIDPTDPAWRDLILRKRAEIDAQRRIRRDPERR